jgi:hypothetical protein
MEEQMATLVTERARPGWRFWLAWMAATIAGVAGYMIVIPPLFPVLNDLLGGTRGEESIGIAIAALGAIALGATIGAAQWLVLRGYLPRSSLWVAATLVGCAAPQVFPWIVSGLEPSWLNGVVMFLLWGFVLGALQWLVLRRRVERAGWWIAISVAVWMLAFGLTGLAEVSGMYVEPFDLLAAFIVPVAVAGGGMVWLLRRSAAPVSPNNLPR